MLARYTAVMLAAVNHSLGLAASAHGAVDYFVMVGPFIIGICYYAAIAFNRYILRIPRDPWYDPRPSRAWFIVACFNLILLPFGYIPLTVGTLLLVMLLYISNHEFGTQF